MGFDRARASARRLIAANGEACTWTRPAAHNPAADPWRDERTGSPTTYSVPIAWFSPKDLGRGREQALMQIKDTEVAQGFEIGLMAADGFEPLATDTVTRSDGRVQHIAELDRLGPDGQGIIYYVKVAR